MTRHPAKSDPARAAFAPEEGGWIAVAAIAGRHPNGDWQTGVSMAALLDRGGGQPWGQWRGEVVLRDGVRLAVGPSETLQVVAAEEGLRLRPLRSAASGVAEALLQAARLELRLRA